MGGNSMNTTEINSIPQQHKINNILFLSLLIGQLLFTAVAVFVVQSGNLGISDEELDSIFIIIVPLFGMTAMFISRFIYNKKAELVKMEPDKLKRISVYRTAKIISWAMVEGAVFFSLVIYIYTSKDVYIAVALFLIGFFIFNRPSKEQFKEVCNLSESDFQ